MLCLNALHTVPVLDCIDTAVNQCERRISGCNKIGALEQLSHIFETSLYRSGHSCVYNALADPMHELQN